MRLLRFAILVLATFAFAAAPAWAASPTCARAMPGSASPMSIAADLHHARVEAPGPCRGHHADCGDACCGATTLSPLVAAFALLDRRAIVGAAVRVVGDDAWHDGAQPGLLLRPPRTA